MRTLAELRASTASSLKAGIEFDSESFVALNIVVRNDVGAVLGDIDALVVRSQEDAHYTSLSHFFPSGTSCWMMDASAYLDFKFMLLDVKRSLGCGVGVD